MKAPSAFFREALFAAGLQPPGVIEPGLMHRFPGKGKSPNNRAGWCVLFDDGQGGCFGDWSSGLSEVWQARRDRQISHAERNDFRQQVQKAREQAEINKRAQQAEAAQRAKSLWDAATPAPTNHPYLIKKRVRPYAAKLYKNALLLPIADLTGKLTSLQFIGPDGSKRLLRGGRKAGCFISVSGDTSHFSRIVICEGWATGCTLAEDDHSALVLAALDAGNLEKVAVGARCRWPTSELVVAGDDDRLTSGNPGKSKATIAADAAGAKLALPQWPKGAPAELTDFNDLAVWSAKQVLQGGVA